MFSFKSLIPLVLIGSAAAVPAFPTGGLSHQPVANKTASCGELNVILVGLPPYHPLVTSQGWDGDFVAENLAIDTANIPKAGYNYMRVLFGPEQDVTGIMARKMAGIKWDVALVGYGVRGSNNTVVTSMLETILATYREKAPIAEFAFNHSPSSSLEAIQRHATISGDCSEMPGKDLGTETFCDVPEVCTKEF